MTIFALFWQEWSSRWWIYLFHAAPLALFSTQPLICLSILVLSLVIMNFSIVNFLYYRFIKEIFWFQQRHLMHFLIFNAAYYKTRLGFPRVVKNWMYQRGWIFQRWYVEVRRECACNDKCVSVLCFLFHSWTNWNPILNALPVKISYLTTITTANCRHRCKVSEIWMISGELIASGYLNARFSALPWRLYLTEWSSLNFSC